MKKRSVVFWLATVLVTWACDAQSLPLEKLADNVVRHTASGWRFQKQLGTFTRIGDPQCDGDVCAANYEDAHKSDATVYVYSDASPAIDASYAGAKAVIETKIKDLLFAQVWSEGPFRVGSAWPIVGEKIFYKIGLGPNSSQTNLYYFDTGKWVVKIRISGPTADSEVFGRVDGFVRNQDWDALALTSESCKGKACHVDRPLEIHGSLPEMFATLLVDQKLREVFPKKTVACEPSALSSTLSERSQNASSEQIAVLAACSLDRNMKVSFLRMNLADDVLQKLEPSPDGLSLRGPISFVIVSNGKSSVFGQLHDGQLDNAEVEKVLSALRSQQFKVFAKGDRNGKRPAPEIRFLK